jgi:DNA-binding LytR/AlgR family response regulator
MNRALIIEDDPDDATALRSALEVYGRRHGLEFKVEWSQVASAVSAGIRDFDVVFLDIELPGINGMEAATLMRSYDADTPIIFVTSLSQYAVSGYEVGAAGFIVKPVNQAKLEMCMDKIAGRLRNSGPARVVVPTGSGVRVLPVRDIYYIELVRHDLVFHLASGGEPVSMRGTIQQLGDAIDEDGPLLQISSGCIVNMDYVRLMRGPSVTMENGEELPLSRRRRKDALAAFSRYLGRTF